MTNPDLTKTVSNSNSFLQFEYVTILVDFNFQSKSLLGGYYTCYFLFGLEPFQNHIKWGCCLPISWKL